VRPAIVFGILWCVSKDLSNLKVRNHRAVQPTGLLANFLNPPQERLLVDLIFVALVVSKEGRVKLVTDCKNKRLEPSEFKNHDIYQMLAYCTATQVQRGLPIYPVHAAMVQDPVVIRNSGRVIRQTTVDLGKESIEEQNEECETFSQTVFDWLHAQAA
jgi:hypothetical protein